MHKTDFDVVRMYLGWRNTSNFGRDISAGFAVSSWHDGGGGAQRLLTRLPTNHLRGVRKFYKAPDRSGIVWTDDDVASFLKIAPEPLADAVVFMRETGLRPGDLVRVARRHLFDRADGGKTVIITTNKKGRTANVPLTPAALAIIEKAPLTRQLILKPPVAEAWGEVYLSYEVKKIARAAGLRPELRLYDLRGTKVTELIWRERYFVPDLALHMGWDVETAAKMMGIYGARNPDALSGGTKVVSLPAADQGQP